jgi:hypothetical protein
MALLLFSGTWGKMIHEKNLKQKISCHCPFTVGSDRGQQDILREELPFFVTFCIPSLNKREDGEAL